MQTRVKAKPYYAPGSLSAAFYDVVTAADTRLTGDEAVYAGLAPASSAVLELGCGTGRLTVALAQRGFEVVGVDLAPSMLAQAQARRAGLNPADAARIELRRGDMTDLELRRRFDLVICPFFTLAHVPAGAAWRNTFAVAARHLTDRGCFAIHLPKVEIMRLPGPKDPSRPVMEQPLPDGRRLQLFVRERSFRVDIGRLDQVLDYVVLDATGAPLARSPERLTYYAADPTPFAEAAGLALDRPPVEHGGVGDIWVFRKG